MVALQKTHETQNESVAATQEVINEPKTEEPFVLGWHFELLGERYHSWDIDGSQEDDQNHQSVAPSDDNLKTSNISWILQPLTMTCSSFCQFAHTSNQ